MGTNNQYMQILNRKRGDNNDKPLKWSLDYYLYRVKQDIMLLYVLAFYN